MCERLLENRVIHCDETRVQVLKEPDREPSNQFWMWVQTSVSLDKPVILFDYSSSRVLEVSLRLLEGYRGYLMTDDYAGYNLGCSIRCRAFWLSGTWATQVCRGVKGAT
jgi:hypothetical protein